MGPCWHYFSLLGASWKLSMLLAAFVVALGFFLCVLNRSGLDFGGFWEGRGKVLDVPGAYFLRFLRAKGAALRKCSEPYKTLAGATKIKVFYISRALHESQKTIQNRSRSLSNRTSHKDCVKNWSSASPGSILEGTWALLGGF